MQPAARAVTLNIRAEPRRRDLIGHAPAFLGAVQDDVEVLFLGQSQDIADVGRAVDGHDQRHAPLHDRDQGLQIRARTRRSPSARGRW